MTIHMTIHIPTMIFNFLYGSIVIYYCITIMLATFGSMIRSGHKSRMFYAEAVQAIGLILLIVVPCIRHLLY